MSDNRMSAIRGLSLNMFNQTDLERIHQATLDVMWQTGIKVESKEAIDIFQSAGCTIERDGSGSVVKIPDHVVNSSIESCPETFVFYGRNPDKDWAVGGSALGFSFFGENVNIIDPQTRQKRSCTKDDLAKASRLGDFFGDTGPFIHKCMGSLDKMPESQALHNYHAMVSNTDKHVVHGFYSRENAKRMFEMAAASVGGLAEFKRRPIVTNMVCPISPLLLSENVCDMTIECAEMGTGLIGTTMPLAGVTGPTTLAGSLVVMNAELLAVLVLCQIITKGMPYMYANYGTIMDLKIGVSALGAPEAGLFAAISSKLAAYYKIPIWCGVGISDSKLPDAQAAYENSTNMLLAAMGGANIVDGIGGLESGLTFDYAKAVMDIEHAQNIQTIMKGCEVSDETLALDIIDKVGFTGGYMMQMHTLNHMREQSRPRLFDRTARESWEADTGGKDLTERAYELAAHIIETHQPAPLADSVNAEMLGIIEAHEQKMSRS